MSARNKPLKCRFVDGTECKDDLTKHHFKLYKKNDTEIYDVYNEETKKTKKIPHKCIKQIIHRDTNGVVTGVQTNMVPVSDVRPQDI